MTDQSNSFWQKVQQTTEQALASGALQPISTQLHELPDQGIPFSVRVVENLRRKEAAQKERQQEADAKPFNPFLPYEEALLVDQLSASHICLLNKFNVVPYHLLIVTREYEAQESWLTDLDFQALARCLLQVDGLGFYNSGKDAGASQHHKHLQVIPFESEKRLQALPISVPLTAHEAHFRVYHTVPIFPYWHSIYALPQDWSAMDEPDLVANLSHTYRRIMVDLGLDLSTPVPSEPYNLLVTREWMMGVRRSQATFQGIGVNSLGYAGWLLVKTPQEFNRLEQIGPLNLLHQVSCSPPANSPQEGEESD